jgi:hypothetical protein
MQRVLLKVVAATILFFAGCATVSEWMSGSISEGIPKLRKKLPRSAKIYFADPVNARGYVLHERNRGQIQDAFAKAFDALGVSHSVETNGCDHTLRVVVEKWEYNDSGFFGSGDRDEVSISILLVNNDTDRVLARSSLYAKDLDLIVSKYVKMIFEDEK